MQKDLGQTIHNRKRKLELAGLEAARKLCAEHVDFTNDHVVKQRMRASIVEKLAISGPTRMQDLKIFLYAEWFETRNPELIDAMLDDMLNCGEIIYQYPGSTITLPAGD